MAVSNNVATTSSNGLSSIEKEFTCAICHELFVRAHTLLCSHTFCEQCISHWLKNNKICPICRKEVVGKAVHSIVLDNAISKLAECLPKQPNNSKATATKPKSASSKHECSSATTNDRTTNTEVNGTHTRSPSSANWSGWRNGEDDYYNDDGDNYDRDYEDDEEDYEDDDDYYEEEDYYEDGYNNYSYYDNNVLVEHHYHYFYGDGYHEEEYSEEESDYYEEDGDDFESEYHSEDDYQTDESVDEYDNGPDYNGLPGYYWGKRGHCFKCGDRYHWANGCPNR